MSNEKCEDHALFDDLILDMFCAAYLFCYLFDSCRNIKSYMDYGDYNKEHSEKTQRNYANTEVKILSSVIHIHILICVRYN